MIAMHVVLTSAISIPGVHRYASMSRGSSTGKRCTVRAVDPADLPVAVIGAGPVGLAAAAHLLERGLEPLVLEATGTVGGAVAQWGHVRRFSPWKDDVDAAAASAPPPRRLEPSCPLWTAHRRRARRVLPRAARGHPRAGTPHPHRHPRRRPRARGRGQDPDGRTSSAPSGTASGATSSPAPSWTHQAPGDGATRSAPPGCRHR